MFITFEGPDGSGKTTQIAMLAAHLKQQGISVVTTREPGGTRIGDQVRGCLHDVHNTAMMPVAEILLYSASRAQLVGEVIRPALAAGKVVLCDRYADSTIAYQGYGRGLDLEALVYITDFATGGLRPDLTILLSLDISEGLRRRVTQGAEMNRMDLQAEAFYRRVQAGYRQLVAAEPERWVVVDGDQPPQIVQQEIQTIVAERLAEGDRD
ncbi:MAG: dTMP kinase [Candidatus Promineifilaceae bacterium]|nr:dTMP kinase [Candidatus Promineifilaceae bacterium]